MNDLFRPSEVLYWVPAPETRNFGDYISDLFLDKLLVAPRIHASRYRFVGSVIDDENLARDLEGVEEGGELAFWGCGARDAAPIREDLFRRCRFFGVRGPLTRDLLGLDEATTLGDPALLLPLIHPAPAPEARRGGAILTPHIFEPTSDEALLERTGVDRIVRPEIAPSLTALGRLVDEISGADFVLAGALHAAIVAHAYGVPFAFFDAGHLDAPFKWRDFAASIGAPTAFVRDVKDGRTAWADLIRPRARRLALSPILAACPWYVRPSVVARAAAHDAGLELDARVLARLGAAGFEAKAYAQAAADSERRREARLQVQFDAQAAALARAEAGRAELEAARAALSEALIRKTAALIEAERACGRWMADADRLAAEVLAGPPGCVVDIETELRVRRQEVEDQAAELAGLQADLDAAETRALDLEAEVAVRRQEVGDQAAELTALQADYAAAEARASGLEAKRRALAVAIPALQADQAAAERRRDQLEAALARGEAERADLRRRLAEAEAGNRRLDFEAAAGAQERRILGEAVSALEARHGDLLRHVCEAEARADDFARVLEAGRSRERAAGLEDRVKTAGLARPVWPWAEDAVDLAFARLFARRRAWRRAERAYGRLLARSPGHARILVQYGHALKAQGEMELAAEAYARAWRLAGPDPDTARHLAFALSAAGRPAEAEAFEAELTYPPESAADAPVRAGLSVTALLGRIWAVRAAKARDWPRAAGRWAKVVRAAPAAGRAWVQYGHALKESGALRDALLAYLRALRLGPGRADTHLQTGHAFKLAGRREEAERAYARAFALSPSDGRARVELAATGRSDAELIELVLAADARPRAAVDSLAAGPCRLMAKLSAKRRDWAGAARWYGRQLRSAPGDWKSWVQRGHALKEQGRLDEAEGAYLEAVARAPSAADPPLQLAHLLKLRGEQRAALLAFERACRLDPAPAEAWREAQALRAELSPAAPEPADASPATRAPGRVGREARLRGVLDAALAAAEDR